MDVIRSVGMIDWLTLILDASLLGDAARHFCLTNTDRIQRINPVTGEVRWETFVRETIRSDSHQVTIHFGATLTIQGSPSRIKNCNNVFGSLDIRQCATDMIDFCCAHLGVLIPRRLEVWRCSKIDVTQNYDLGSLAQVQQSIDAFKHVRVGRQKTSTEDTTVMWGKGSTLHMGKIYAKGPHARKMMTAKSAVYTEDQLRKADRLLRVEYSIRRLMIRRLKEGGLEWYQLTPEKLLAFHADYFSKFISDVEVADMDNVLDLLLANVGSDSGQVKTEGQAHAAYDCYCRCRNMGFQVAKSSFPSSSWSRHLKNLSTVGIGPADLQSTNIVPLRRRQVVLDQPVSSWDDIKLAQRA